MTTGTVMPRMSLVRSLNCDTNWPMFTPCWPRAGPTGGAGVACPPVTCKRIWAVTCRAMSLLSSHRPAGHARARPPKKSQPTTNGGGDPFCLLRRRGRLPHRLRRNLLLYALDLPVFHLHEYRPTENGQLDLHLIFR